MNTQSSLQRITVNLSAKNVLWHFALLLLATLALSSSFARAQQTSSPVAAPRIDGFDVEPAGRLSAGNDLAFTLRGSAGGTAAVQINGVVSALPLEEVAAGVYAGTYTIKCKDRFAAVATVIANLRVANRIATRIATEVLDQSLLVSVATHSRTRHEADVIALAAPVRRTDCVEPDR